ncbi:MAG: hypothetical protein E6Q96_06055 [Cyclobacteriaceae bacterium]|nr:MAG: hypothetical protein E6Q96_06055 [Cyclobacteriaceae bacterium]
MRKELHRKTHTMKAMLVCIVYFLVSASQVVSQNYPVQVTCQVVPPVGVSLAELQSPLSPVIQASAVLTDLNRPSFDVRLRLTIEGQGIVLRTRNEAVLPPIRLLSGEVKLLDFGTIKPYLDVNNLDIEGISRTQFIKSGMRLPEGPYNFCIEALDYHRITSLPVSNTACAPTLLQEYEPPLLFPPDLSNQILFDNQPPAFQQAVFTWQPQHIGIFPVEYELRIYRRQPGMQQLPQGVIMQETPPYIRIKTAATSYALSPTDPPLLLDETYFAEVQISPVNYPAIFKNRGKSAMVEFIVAPDESQICVGPQDYRGHSLTEGISLQWKMANYCDRYVTEWLDEKDNTYHYQTLRLGTNAALVDTVREVYSGRNYVLRTGCMCGSDTVYSDTIRIDFRRPAVQIPEFECGSDKGMPEPITTLLPVLMEGDTVIASDMRVIIRKAVGSNGIFSGKGHVEVPYFKYARVNVVFKDITINDEHRMVAGEMHIIGVGQNILDDDIVDGLNDIQDGLSGMSDGLGGAIGNLDSINKMRDILGDNIPPWLIDSIQIIQDLIANTSDDGLKEKLQKLLDELNQQKRDWELMYINLVIACLENIQDENKEDSLTIVSSYNTTAKEMKKIAFDPMEMPPLPDTISFNYTIEVIEYTLEEYAAIDPDVGGQMIAFSKEKARLSQMIMVDKLLKEYNSEKGSSEVILLVALFASLGDDIIPKMKNEFESRGWDMEKITNDKGIIITLCTGYVSEAVNTVYWHLN